METEYSKGYDLQGGQGSHNEALLSLPAHFEQGQLIVCNACLRTIFIKGQLTRWPFFITITNEFEPQLIVNNYIIQRSP